MWFLEYEAGKGFTLKNAGTGLYLHEASPAKYTDKKYFQFCTLKESTTGVREVKSEEGLARRPEGESQFATANWFTLDGRKLNGQPTQHGIYIVNGKKIIR